MSQPLRVAVVGAGPAGIYAADILTKADPDVTVDLFDRLPTPYGLIRYGVAPDHPRIKQIIVALHQVMENPRIAFFGNVARRHRPQGRRTAPVLRRGHLRHRRGAGQGR